MSQNLDKFESHYRQQLSALMDGALAPDEARFMLRRLAHDDELAGCWERWQLCGDVLRGRACAPAPKDFGQRVAQALAAEAIAVPPLAAAAGGGNGLLRRPWVQWSGGAALAASVAAVAFMIGRGQVAEPAASPSMPVLASSAPAGAVLGQPDPRPAQSPASQADPAAAVAATAAVVAVAAAERRPVAPRPAAVERAAAGRNAVSAPQRMAALASAAPEISVPVLAPLVADGAAPAALPSPATRAGGNPFGVDTPQARPWPRSVLPQYTASGAFNASVQVESGAGAFYPFEPRLPALPAPNPAAAAEVAPPPRLDPPPDSN